MGGVTGSQGDLTHITQSQPCSPCTPHSPTNPPELGGLPPPPPPHPESHRQKLELLAEFSALACPRPFPKFTARLHQETGKPSGPAPHPSSPRSFISLPIRRSAPPHTSTSLTPVTKPGPGLSVFRSNAPSHSGAHQERLLTDRPLAQPASLIGAITYPGPGSPAHQRHAGPLRDQQETQVY